MPRKTLLDQRAETLAKYLSEHGLAAPHDTLVTLIRGRRDAVAKSMGIGHASAMRYLDEEALRDLAAILTAQLAEEVPLGGGDPWTGPERVVFPASLAGRFSWSLGLVIEASLRAGDVNRATLAVQALIGLSRMISEMDDGASVVFAPKEGLVYVARVLEVAATAFAGGDLSIEHPEAASAAAIAPAMSADAAALRRMVEDA
jgi:hypothetical protein